MTEFEKQIYNCWLAVTRAGANKPYKLRKKWDDFEENRDYIFVKKLAYFFRRHDNINISDYFKAPYIVYNELVVYDLRFYNSMKAMKCYKIYKDKIKDKK